MYSDREFLSNICQPSIGIDKPCYFNIRAYISYFNGDQAMWYDACNLCLKKAMKQDADIWCQTCQKHVETLKRYVVFMRLTDSTGEAWVTAFNEEANKMFECTVDELHKLRFQDHDKKTYLTKLKQIMWTPKIFRVSVLQTKQRIIIRDMIPVQWSGEINFMLGQLTKLK